MYATKTNVFEVRLSAIILLIVIGACWPGDFYLFQDDPETFRVFRNLRGALISMLLLMLLLLWVSPGCRRHVSWVYTVLMSLGCGLCGYCLGRIGGIDTPWYYACYANASATLFLLVGCWFRLISTTIITAAWPLMFFLTYPEYFKTPQVFGILLFQASTILSSLIAGHLIYHLSRSNFFQKQFIQKTFGRYFSKDLVNLLLTRQEAQEMGGQEHLITILFSDLQGYSTIIEHLEPAQVVDMLNEYLGEMQKVIDAHKGCILEYIGDAILVIFGAPNDLPNHAEYAVNCALEMQKTLLRLNEKWDETGFSNLWKHREISSLVARIGIHTGKVITGNIGSPNYMKYGIVGDSVNVAARLEALNKTTGTSMLISEETYTLLPQRLQSLAGDRGTFRLKGRASLQRVYSFDLTDLQICFHDINGVRHEY